MDPSNSGGAGPSNPRDYNSFDDREFDDLFTSESQFCRRAAAVGNVFAGISNLLYRVAADVEEEEEEEAATPISRRVSVARDHAHGHQQLMSHYFDDVQPLYDGDHFRRRFRMQKRLFFKIVADLGEAYPYFRMRSDVTGRPGLSPLQKCTAAIRQLAYGQVSDAFDEYLQMSERTARESVMEFCNGILELYRSRYLRRPTPRDIRRIYSVHEQVHTLPGMLGSVDCMHWIWATCPTAWRGSHTRGDIGKPSVMLQAVASYDLWIWHAFFGMQGSLNDINVFESSPLLEEIVSGLAPKVPFTVQGNRYSRGYYLGDGIYPDYSIFVTSFSNPIHANNQLFKTRQESARKDIERAFGVLKKRWKIIAIPSRFSDKERMKVVMYACIILHNMILEDEGKATCQDFDPTDPSLVPEYWTQETPQEQRRQNILAVRSKEIHNMLKADLVRHVWEKEHPQEENDED